jgi:hypothetical protein
VTTYLLILRRLTLYLLLLSGRYVVPRFAAQRELTRVTVASIEEDSTNQFGPIRLVTNTIIIVSLVTAASIEETNQFGVQLL